MRLDLKSSLLSGLKSVKKMVNFILTWKAEPRAGLPLREVYDILSLFLFPTSGCWTLSNGPFPYRAHARLTSRILFPSRKAFALTWISPEEKRTDRIPRWSIEKFMKIISFHSIDSWNTPYILQSMYAHTNSINKYVHKRWNSNFKLVKQHWRCSVNEYRAFE